MIQAIGASAYVKKAFDKKSYGTTAARLEKDLVLDPSISGIDLVILIPRDLLGVQGKSLLQAVNRKHPEVRVVYMFIKDKENLDFESTVSVVKVKKMTPEIIHEIATDALQGLEVAKREVKIVSNDYGAHSASSEKPKRGFWSFGRAKEVEEEEHEEDDTEEEYEFLAKQRREQEEQEQEEVVTLTQEADEPILIEEEIEVLPEVIEDHSPIIPESIAKQQLTSTKAEPIEERVKNVQKYEDWDAFQSHLKRDNVLRELLHENTQFSGAINMLEVLDRQIQTVFTDATRSTDDKLREIRELALNRSTLKDQYNNILVQKVSQIMSSIVLTVENTVEQRLARIKNQFDQVANVNMFANDRSRLQALVEERLQIQVELNEMTMGLLNTYKLLDTVVEEEIENLDSGLPSENAYINEVLKPISPMFTPKSAAELASKLLDQLAGHRETLSLLETSVKEIITLVFKLCDLDTKIINHQAQTIKLLEAQRIEEVIITDTLLKSALRVFIGQSGTGVHTTAITASGVASRQRNTLLIDLTGDNHYEAYNIPYVKLEDFREHPQQSAFVCVMGTLTNSVDLKSFITDLNRVVGYYPNIHIILNETQQPFLEILGESALAVNFVTNCTPESIDTVGDIIAGFKLENVARKAVLIDAEDPMYILSELNLDPLFTKLVSIPHITKLKTFALRGIPPYKDTDVLEIYEAAFK